MLALRPQRTQIAVGFEVDNGVLVLIGEGTEWSQMGHIILGLYVLTGT